MTNDQFMVRIERQDHPSQPSYWQSFVLDYVPGWNITSVLRRISVNPTTKEGSKVTPVAYESGCLEEVCGSCTMRINGRVRQACSALVDRLLTDDPTGQGLATPRMEAMIAPGGIQNGVRTQRSRKELCYQTHGDLRVLLSFCVSQKNF